MACHEKVKKALTSFFSTTKLRPEKTFSSSGCSGRIVKNHVTKKRV